MTEQEKRDLLWYASMPTHSLYSLKRIQELTATALAELERLEKLLDETKRAAIRDIKIGGTCICCVHFPTTDKCKNEWDCESCREKCICGRCVEDCHFAWRGVNGGE